MEEKKDFAQKFSQLFVRLLIFPYLCQILIRITHYALRITHYALRITHYALRITHYKIWN